MCDGIGNESEEKNWSYMSGKKGCDSFERSGCTRWQARVQDSYDLPTSLSRCMISVCGLAKRPFEEGDSYHRPIAQFLAMVVVVIVGFDGRARCKGHYLIVHDMTSTDACHSLARNAIIPT